jgi:hypothetical protein
VNRAHGRHSLGPLPRDAFQDCVEQRRRFEAEQTDVTIVTPARPDDRWRAILPLGVLPDDGTIIGAWSLCGLMNKLDSLYPHGEQD